MFSSRGCLPSQEIYARGMFYEEQRKLILQEALTNHLYGLARKACMVRLRSAALGEVATAAAEALRRHLQQGAWTYEDSMALRTQPRLR